MERNQQKASVERFASDGFAVFENLFDVAFIEDLHREYVKQFADVESHPPDDTMEVGSRRVQVAVEMKGAFLSPALFASPTVLRFAREVLGEEFLIDSVACVSALPGASEQHLHRDHPDLFPEQPLSNLVLGSFGFTLVVPLVDLTPETGSTRLVAGTRPGKVEETKGEVPYIPRGSAFVMDYRLWHQGTPNRSADQRPMIYIVYTRPWFTDMINYGDKRRINIRPGDAAAVADEHKPLFRRILPMPPARAGNRTTASRIDG